MRLLGFSKSQKHILTASKMLCMLLLCSSCTARQSTDMSKDSGSATVTDVTQYIESEGKTGVVLEAGMLQDCFTLRVAETSDTSVKQNVESIESMDEQTISAGDIVLILDENPPDHEGMTRVMIPYGVNTGCTLPSARTFSATSPEKSSHLTAVVFHLWDDIL